MLYRKITVHARTIAPDDQGVPVRCPEHAVIPRTTLPAGRIHAASTKEGARWHSQNTVDTEQWHTSHSYAHHSYGAETDSDRNQQITGGRT